MAKWKKGYDNSFFGRLERFVKQGADPLDDSMEESLGDQPRYLRKYTPEEQAQIERTLEERHQRDMENEHKQYERLHEWSTTKGQKIYNGLYRLAAALVGLGIIFILLGTVAQLPSFGASDNPINNEVSRRYVEDGMAETGAVNTVAGMILDYRAFDTLGESHVLFTAMCAVVILVAIGGDKKQQLQYDDEEQLYDTTKDPVLRGVALFLIPCLLVFGVYILLNGHLSPGGGFSGGAILGAALILYAMTYGFDAIGRFMNARSIKVISCVSLGFYVLAKSYSFFTGANELHSIVGTGTPGAILSAGLILPLNVAVGMVVACTMYSFFSLFKRGTI